MPAEASRWWTRGLLATALCAATGCETPSDDGADDGVDPDDDPVATATGDTAPTGPVDTDTPVSTALVSSSPEIVCADPDARYDQRFDLKQTDHAEPDVYYTSAAGGLIADVTGDGIQDVIGVEQDRVLLYRTNADLSLTLMPPLFTRDMTGREGLFGVSAADYDGDLDLDVFLTAYPGENVLFRNEGDGTFVDVTDVAGLAGPAAHHSNSSAWADYDLDGDLDLVVSGHGYVDEEGTAEVQDFEPADDTLLYRNEGDGTFADVTHLIDPAIHPDYTFTIGFTDLDGDLRPDLYLANDFAGKRGPSRYLRNTPSGFTLEGAEPTLTSNVTGMGLGLGDINDDGDLDVLLPGWNALALLVSQQGLWFDMSQSARVRPDRDRDQKVAWGTELADFDNDGDLDALVSFGWLHSRFSSNQPDQPDALFLQTDPDNTVFSERGRPWMLDQRSSTRAVATGDLNGDGWVDVLKVSTDAPIRVFLSRCGTMNWARFQLRQEGMNRHAIGAQLRIHTADGVQHRRVFAGGTGYASSNPPEVMVGLGESDTIERVEITWPDGATDVVYDLPARRIHTLTRDDDASRARP